MNGEEFRFAGEDGKDIYAVKWIPEGPVRAALLLNHGMAEHMGRYEDFALFLNRSGIAVWGEDHRGHGHTAASGEELGFFHGEKGWEKVLSDLRTLADLMEREHSGTPLFVLGHSMGSFLTRDLLCDLGERFRGAILSGTGYTPAGLCRIMGFLAACEALLRGERHRSRFLDNLSFGQFNRNFRPNRTAFDWLSRDNVQVDRYIDDPLCGFVCTTGFYRDLSRGLLRILDRKRLSRTPRELPLMLYSGDEDPVGGDRASGVSRVESLYLSAGMKNLILRLNRGGRHESLNEINREEVYREFLGFMEEHIPG